MHELGLLALGKPYIALTEASEGALTDLQQRLTSRAAGNVIRVIRGRKCRTYSGFFDEVGAALQFPLYFGGNWNAFDECITDLDWLPGQAYLLMFSNAESVLSDESPEEFGVLALHLAKAGEEWRKHPNDYIPRERPPTPFHALFQTENSRSVGLERRLTLAGVQYGHVTLS